jgi:hypothetical protein
MMKESDARARSARALVAHGFKLFKLFHRCAPFNPSPLSSPATRGEDEGGGLIDLNGLNGLNLSIMEEIWRKLKSKRA